MQNRQILDMEKRLTAVEVELKTISTNHLPHLQTTSDKILWWIIATLLTLVLTFMGLVVHGLLTYKSTN